MYYYKNQRNTIKTEYTQDYKILSVSEIHAFNMYL